MNDIVDIETIPTAIIGNLSRKEIKDKAADMVVGLDSDDIKSYNPESSRKNRILNRVYNRYNKKYNDEKFTSLSLREINKLPTKEQERWFALNKSKTAGPILSGMLAATSIPMTLGGLVTAGSTVLTLFSLAGGFGGSYVGSKIGEEYDKNRHGLSNNTLAGSLVGGTAGGFIGGFTPYIGNKIIYSPAVRNTVGAVKLNSHIRRFNIGKNANFNNRLMRTFNRDRFIEENLDFGANSGYLVHGDPVATGVTYPAAGAVAPAGTPPKNYPHFQNGYLVPGKGNIYSAVSKSYTDTDHPIF